MPKPRKAEIIQCQYFSWRLTSRDGVYQADGRSNQPSTGRHSLGTRDRHEALAALQQLDLHQAVKHGLAERSALKKTEQLIDIAAGRKLYEQHAQRPAVSGGPRESTRKRYRAVLDKFSQFADSNNIRYWNQVARNVLDGYAAWLDAEGYEYATQYLELTTLKQIVKHLVEQEHLPRECLFPYPLRKPDGTDTYCWRTEEVQAMMTHCRGDSSLSWLGDVIVALACTGLRISELGSLRWTDIDLDGGTIRLTDESRSGRRRGTTAARTTKSGRSRSFPIHAELQPVFTALPKSSDGFVFHGPRGGRLKPDTVRRMLIRDVLDPLAFRFPDSGFHTGRLHSFRHYFCSCCANEGIPEQMLMRWLGHRNSRMVQHYYHLNDQDAQRQMRRVSFVGARDADI